MMCDEPEQKQKTLEPRDLEERSIESLVNYILELEAEIERVREAIKLKQDARAGANTFFRS